MNVDATIEQLENLYQNVTGEKAPITRQPYAPIRPEVDPSLQISQQIDRLVQMLHVLQGQQSTNSMIQEVQTAWRPTLQVIETKDDYQFLLEVAGIKKENLEIQILGNTLVVRGSRDHLVTDNHANIHHSELAVGQFERALTIPAYTIVKNLSAKLNNGILEIKIPKDKEVTSLGKIKIS